MILQVSKAAALVSGGGPLSVNCCNETLPLGRSGPVEVLWPESEGGRDGAPDAAEDGGPTRHGELIPAQRAIHGNVPSEPIQYAA